MFDFIKNIGTTEYILIAVILILIFGAKMITKFGRSSGETFKEIKKIKNEFTKAVGTDDNEPNKN